MAWTAPMTWVGGTNPTAAQLNTHIRDNETWLKDALSLHGITSDSTLNKFKQAKVGVHLGGSGSQSISDATDTTMTWDVESYDTDAFHSTSSDTARITIPAGLDGLYIVGYCVRFDASATGDRRVWVEDDAGTILSRVTARAPASGFAHMGHSFVWALTAGEYVACKVWQSSGGALSIDKTVASTWFQAHRLFAS